MVTITLHCPHWETRRCGAQWSCPECANTCIAAVPADGKAVRIRLPTPMHQRAARRSCRPLWNNTLRQRLARFVRMTLSFSKSVVMLRPPVCFSSFHRYNTERAILLK